MNKVLVSTILILTLCYTTAFSQELRLIASDQPLNTVLRTLNLEISYNDRDLSNYKVTINKSFSNSREALLFLLKDKPFSVEQLGDVYIILPVKKELATEKVKTKDQPTYYTITGIITDASSKERLPYAHIYMKKRNLTSDKSGVFSINRTTSAPVTVKICYMGYQEIDTLLSAGVHTLLLRPATIELDEVVVQSSPATLMMQSGQKSGEMRVNHQVSRYMPGGVDNSVFTLLRMMPGIRASGESSGDLIIWGSNTGESMIKFDGFTLFGMKNFNEHISSINPYLVKDVRLLKGGYDASYGNRVGGIVELIGNEGDYEKPALKVNLSNYAANAFASIPISSKSVLSAAYRQTYYNMYSTKGVAYYTEPPHESQKPSKSNVYIGPWYSFRDVNLKYSGQSNQKDYYFISLYTADDRFKSEINQNGQNGFNARELNRQYGVGSEYNKYWNNGSATRLQVSLSRFSSEIDNISGLGGQEDDAPLNSINTKNSILEWGAKLEHNLNVGSCHKLQFGTEWKEYDNRLNNRHKELHVPTLFITDHIIWGKLSVDVGVRGDFLPRGRSFFQPRLSTRYTVSDELSLTASGGWYHQFITRIPYEYSPKSYQVVWSLSDSTFLRSGHLIAGATYSKNGYLFNLEGYYKHIHNGLYVTKNMLHSSENDIWGLDLYAKKGFRGQTLFGSYSLVGIRVPHKEFGRELKLGAIASYKDFRLSLTYIRGGGFTYLSTGNYVYGIGQEVDTDDANGETEFYQRFDIALTYKLQMKKCKLQLSGSLLNVFDNRNVKDRYQLSENNNLLNVYTKATPFTPMISAEIVF